MIEQKIQLKGLRVLNTRPHAQGLALSQAINAAGGKALVFPLLEIVPVTAWLAHQPDLDLIDKAIFISPNAVKFYFKKIKQQTHLWPKHIEVIAIGKACESELKKHGVSVHHMPRIADSEHLLKLGCLEKIDGQNVILIKGEGGRVLIETVLQENGANLTILAVYRSTLPNHSQKCIDWLWHESAVDIILFTSEQAIHNMFALFNDEARLWLCQIPCVVISERLEKSATILGMKTIIISRYDQLLNSLHNFASHQT